MQQKILYAVLGGLLGLMISAVLIGLSLVFLPVFIIFCGTGGGCYSLIGRILTGIYYTVIGFGGVYLMIKYANKGYEYGREREAISINKYGKQPPVGIIVFALCIILSAFLGPESIIILLPLFPVSIFIGIMFNSLPDPLLAMIVALPNAWLIAYLVDLVWKKRRKKPMTEDKIEI